MENLDALKTHKSNKLKYILIFVLILPLLIAVLIYFNNITFRSRMNKLFERLPGPVGEYFRSSPTEDERKDKKTYLAEHYLSLEPTIAADKLYIIKKDDDKLYSEIIRLMNSNSPSKTEEIIKLVRSIELRKDLLFSIHDEIQKEKEGLFLEQVNRLETQDLLITINEIEKRIETDSLFKENLGDIIELIKEERATDILYYIGEDLKEMILELLDNNKKTSIESSLLAKTIQQSKLADLAGLYEVKPVEVAVEEIGNEENYNINELAIIYKNMSVLKSAEILSKLEDDKFIEELFASIRKEEELKNEGDSITNEISKSIQFITEYDKKIEDLVIVYEKMSPDKVAKIVEQMMSNDTKVTVLEIFSEPAFEISDASIIIDVLSRIKNKTLSNIMNYVSEDKASTLTQMLARP